MQSSERQRQWEPDIIDIRRNPYPATYEDERNLPRAVGTGRLKPQRRSDLQEQPISKRRSDLQTQMIPQRRSNLQGQAAPRRRPELQQEQPISKRRSDLQPQMIPQRRSNLQGQATSHRRPELQQEQPNLQRRSDLQTQMIPQRRANLQGQAAPRRRPELQQEQPNLQRRSDLQTQMIPQRRSNLQGQATPRRRPELQQEQLSPRRRSDLQQPISQRRPDQRRQANPAGNARSRQAALQRRRKYIRRQRISVGIFIGCMVAVFCFLVILPKKTSAAGTNRENRITREQKTDQVQTPETFIQGLPATVFSSHPEWTEDFLTPNEFSRPGEALPEIKNIFVHYTANPGTSASQNRSYFEQQKDTHQVSVSAHFIIGYEGEILQCVPLDEIAYAVQSRNYDSVSIECCYKAEDGSFTQETYDSLISLLAWLTDAYDLEAEDILRHYDCGGKKCPLYYTEHPDAWERLKEDVAQASGA